MAGAMDDVNPIFDRHPGCADRAPTRALTSSDRPTPNSQRSVPAAVKKAIAELGLRYRPSAQADLEAHAHMIALLTRDVADIPPHILEAAIDQWCRTKPFLPKASELIELSKQRVSNDNVGTDAALRQLQAHCDVLNAGERRSGSDFRWIVIGEAPRRTIDRIPSSAARDIAIRENMGRASA